MKPIALLYDNGYNLTKRNQWTVLYDNGWVEGSRGPYASITGAAILKGLYYEGVQIIWFI